MNFGTPRRLTRLQGNCLSAVFSPDGEWIAFACILDRHTDVYLIRHDGSDLTRLTSGGTGRGGGAYFDPHFSPDGTRLVCVRLDGPDDEYIDICLLNLGTGTEELLTVTREDNSPRFSPDGRHIVFVSGRDTATQRAHVREIYRMRADGTEQTRLTHTPFEQAGAITVPPTNTKPRYSPSGQYIAFSSSACGQRGENRFEVYVMNADGSRMVRLTHTEGSSQYPLWHPDGTCLVFTCWSHAVSGKYKADIYSVNADGSDQHCLETSDAVNWLNSFSPGGRYLAFDSPRDGRTADIRHNWDLYLRDMETGDVQRVTDNTVLDKHPIFSPDGTRLLFESRRDGWDELYLADVTL